MGALILEGGKLEIELSADPSFWQPKAQTLYAIASSQHSEVVELELLAIKLIATILKNAMLITAITCKDACIGFPACHTMGSAQMQ